GALRWMAPELLENTSGGHRGRTPDTDVYSFAWVCLELYTGRHPLSDLTDAAATLKIINGERSNQPSTMPDALWTYVNECWAENPEVRPSAAVLVADLAMTNDKLEDIVEDHELSRTEDRGPHDDV
ncbi:kinase-like domain-containing protein, partial [Mycena rebaudengoi]